MTSIRYLETVHGTIVWTISFGWNVQNAGVVSCCFLLKIFTSKCSESTWQRSLKNRFHPFCCVDFGSPISRDNTSVCFLHISLAWIPYSWPHHTHDYSIYYWIQTLHIAIPQSSIKLYCKWPTQTNIWFLNSETSERHGKTLKKWINSIQIAWQTMLNSYVLFCFVHLPRFTFEIPVFALLWQLN